MSAPGVAGEEMEGTMVSQMATLAAEAALVGEVMLGAALLLVWTAFEIIGYGGLVVFLVRRQRWLVVSAAPKPARDIRWGTTVRAAGLRARRLPSGRPQPA